MYQGQVTLALQSNPDKMQTDRACLAFIFLLNECSHLLGPNHSSNWSCSSTQLQAREKSAAMFPDRWTPRSALTEGTYSQGTAIRKRITVDGGAEPQNVSAGTVCLGVRHSLPGLRCRPVGLWHSLQVLFYHVRAAQCLSVRECCAPAVPGGK